MVGLGAPRKLRIFFDIDGTLLLTDGAGREAIRSALEAVYGTSGPLDGFHFHGKTDPQIVVELMTGAGLPAPEVRARLASVWPIYLRHLDEELERRKAAGRIRVLPGVVDLLSELSTREEVALGLLTGNIEEGARLKLRAAGVEPTFDVGGYGSDSEVRTEIARIAANRGREVDGEGRTLLVVGDTPDDIACARVVDGYGVGVATGRHGVAELRLAGADAVFEDFGDTPAVLDRLLRVGLASGAPAEGGGEGG